MSVPHTQRAGADTETHPLGGPPLRVLYNAECPICSREIDAYRRQAEAAGTAMSFEGLGAAEANWGIDEDAAARRLHVRRGDEILSGMDAFVALWAALPRTRPLARLAALPGMRRLLGWGYDGLAAPALYALHRRRRRRGG